LLFDGVSAVVRGSVDGLTALLRAIPSPLLILGAAALSWVLRRSLPLAAFVVVALLFIMNQGYWQPTLETLSLVIVAALVSTAIGVPVGLPRRTGRAVLGAAASARSDANTADLRVPHSTLVLFA